jgi:hypothetical protein
VGIHTAPPSTISSEHTVANTGLRMKKLTMNPTFYRGSARINADQVFSKRA